jgi:hypothetical protein
MTIEISVAIVLYKPVFSTSIVSLRTVAFFVAMSYWFRPGYQETRQLVKDLDS